MAAKTAIYTRPQGKKPFKKPMVKNVSGDFFFNSLPRADFTLDIILNKGFEKLYLLKVLYGINTTIIIKTPIAIDSCCCNPNK